MRKKEEDTGRVVVAVKMKEAMPLFVRKEKRAHGRRESGLEK